MIFASMAYSRGSCAAAASADSKNRRRMLTGDLRNVGTGRLDFLRRLPLQKQLPREPEFTASPRLQCHLSRIYATHTSSRIDRRPAETRLILSSEIPPRKRSMLGFGAQKTQLRPRAYGVDDDRCERSWDGYQRPPSHLGLAASLRRAPLSPLRVCFSRHRLFLPFLTRFPLLYFVLFLK